MALRWLVAGLMLRAQQAQLIAQVVLVASGEELFENLLEVGIEIDAEGFHELAREHHSSINFAFALMKRADRKLTGPAEMLIIDSVNEIWARICTDLPRTEDVIELFQQSYGDDGDIDREKLQKGWEILEAILKPEMSTLAEVQALIAIIDVGSCLEDLALCWRNEAIHDPEYADQGITFCQRVIDQFQDEPELVVSFCRTLGELLFLKDEEEGERFLRGLIAESPDRSQGYVLLADCLSFKKGACQELGFGAVIPGVLHGLFLVFKSTVKVC